MFRAKSRTLYLKSTVWSKTSLSRRLSRSSDICKAEIKHLIIRLTTPYCQRAIPLKTYHVIAHLRCFFLTVVWSTNFSRAMVNFWRCLIGMGYMFHSHITYLTWITCTAKSLTITSIAFYSFLKQQQQFPENLSLWYFCEAVHTAFFLCRHFNLRFHWILLFIRSSAQCHLTLFLLYKTTCTSFVKWLETSFTCFDNASNIRIDIRQQVKKQILNEQIQIMSVLE